MILFQSHSMVNLLLFGGEKYSKTKSSRISIFVLLEKSRNMTGNKDFTKGFPTFLQGRFKKNIKKSFKETFRNNETKSVITYFDKLSFPEKKTEVSTFEKIKGFPYKYFESHEATTMAARGTSLWRIISQTIQLECLFHLWKLRNP